jgi:hypothetical protein
MVGTVTTGTEEAAPDAGTAGAGAPDAVPGFPPPPPQAVKVKAKPNAATFFMKFILTIPKQTLDF